MPREFEMDVNDYSLKRDDFFKKKSYAIAYSSACTVHMTLSKHNAR